MIRSVPLVSNAAEPFLRHVRVHGLGEPRPILSDVQKTALDLFQRGWNVIPLPSVHEWRSRPDFSQNPTGKPAYLLEPFFRTRLHLCSATCRHAPLPPQRVFDRLFERANLGLVLGWTSGNLFDIDCDSQAAFENMHRELDQRGLPYFAIHSHRGGSFLMRAAEGELMSMQKTRYDEVEIWGNRHFMVLPPSIHPAGTVYRWESLEPWSSLAPRANIPAISVAALDWLGVQLKKPQEVETELVGLANWTALSRRNRQTLAHGVAQGSRSNSLFSAACDLAANGVDYQTAEALILDAAENCKPPYSLSDSVSIVGRAYQNKREPARFYYRNTTAKAPQPEWQKAAKFADSYDWSQKYGRTAVTHHAVFDACVRRAQMDNRPIFRASVRELGEILNRDIKRIGITLNRLTADSLLERAGTDKSGARLFRFGEVVLEGYSKLPTVRSLTGGDSVGNSEEKWFALPASELEKDAFASLRINAWRVWQHLCVKPERSGYAIARAIKVPSSSVYTSLCKLQACGLVTRDSTTGLLQGIAATDEKLAQVALQAGTAGMYERRRLRHSLERELYANEKTVRARDAYAFRVSQT